MGRMVVVSPRVIRVFCDCKEYVHELERTEDGKVEYQAFVVNAKKKADPPASPAPSPSDKGGKPQKKFTSFFGLEDEREESGEED
jgi:hypothetical protein